MTESRGNLSIGVDVGGTNIRVALYRGLSRDLTGRDSADVVQPLATHRERVGDGRGPEAIADRIARIIEDLLAGGARSGGATDDGGAVPIGIGVAAIMHGHDGVVGNSPHLGWRDVPFGAILRQRLGESRPFILQNDVNAITYGEYALGAGAGVRDLVAVYVGTGIGAGLIVDGRLVAGVSNAAGELGHMKVAWGDDAPPCNCGMRGCVETFIGGSYLLTRIRRDLGSGIESAALALAGGDPARLHPGHIERAAADGDGYALDLYNEIATPFAVALGCAINLLNPARLVLGGGVLANAPILRAHITAALELAATGTILDAVSVVTAALGDDAGLVGGALLASERFGEPA